MKTPVPKLAQQVDRITNRLIFLEKKILLRLGDLKLHPSEIHLMLALVQEPGLGATDLAARLGITKGAVSQTLTRLVKKGVVSKDQDPGQRNRLSLSFTPLGRRALALFESQRQEARAQYAQYLASLTPEEQEIIGRFLGRLDGFLAGL